MYKFTPTVNHAPSFIVEEHVSLQDRIRCQETFEAVNVTSTKDSLTIKTEEKN